jgi:murein L,D-transpeptidase YafK
MTRFKAALTLIVAFIVWTCATNGPPRSVGAENPSPDIFRDIPRELWDTKAPHPRLSNSRIVVKKAERKLFLYSDSKLIRTYRIGLGLSPVGDKVREGDRKTPEGDFYIFTKNDKSAFYLSLGVSYPNAAHAERGLRDKLITKAQYDTIIEALKERRTPPQNTKLGGEIYIHGNGAGRDWTWGCVALEDNDIRELFNSVEVGTPVTIKP